MIPAKSNRKEPRNLYKELYKQRNRIKRFRRLATRYDKLARRFASFILVVSTYVWGCLA